MLIFHGVREKPLFDYLLFKFWFRFQSFSIHDDSGYFNLRSGVPMFFPPRKIEGRLIAAGADPGFFLGGDAPLRNGVTDW